MTRVTKELRHSMERAIMKDLPSRDYKMEIYKLVQDTVIAQLPPEVKALYGNEDLRKYLVSHGIEVIKGNTSVGMYAYPAVYGLPAYMKIRMDDAEYDGRLTEGTQYAAVVKALVASTLVDKYFEQERLRSSVLKRVRSNLEASNTFRQLYANLEPELHQYIPKDEAKAQVPACVAPVVDDLRKLGAVLPEVPKAT